MSNKNTPADKTIANGYYDINFDLDHQYLVATNFECSFQTISSGYIGQVEHAHSAYG